MDTSKYDNLVTTIAERADHMKKALVEPIIDPTTGSFIAESGERNRRLEAETPHSIFESCGTGAATIQASASNAVRQYANQRGRLPADDLLASAYSAIENVVSLTSGSGRTNVAGMVLESATLNTADAAQAMMRNRMIALILPSMLQAVTSNIVGFIPGQFNQSEIFKVWRIAGSTFGDLTANDRIGWNFRGQYGAMDTRVEVGTGDGTDTGSADEFTLNSNTKWGGIRPFKRKSVKIIVDNNIVATDDGNGNLVKFGTTSISLGATSHIDYANGIVHPVFSAAIANLIKVHVQVDIDIEKAPTLIPVINHEMDARTVYPHEAAIAASTTLQALWGMRREFNLNIDNMATVNMKNLLAADKDRKHLRDLYFYRKGTRNWIYTIPASGVSMQDYYETLRTTLHGIDATLMAQTGTSGLVGIVADSKSCAIFKSMRSPHFDPAPGYVRLPQPHYVGRLFGIYDLYEDPQGTDYDCLCFAKGRNICEAAYIAGDAVPALSFKHAVQGDLQYKNTLWELAYRDLQPFDGREYVTTLTMSAS